VWSSYEGLKIMELSVSCDTFVRLAKIASSNDAGYLKSIWLEITDKGDVLAIATNRKIAAIEHLGMIKADPGKMNVCVDEAFVQQCQTETAFNGTITFVNNPVLKFVSAKTSLGYVHATNAGVYTDGKNEFETWRDWFPDEMPKKTNGGIFSNLDNLALLASSAPTASVVFQKWIDAEKPVMVRDVHDDKWVGLFMPRPDAKNRSPEPFAIPTWVEKT